MISSYALGSSLPAKYIFIKCSLYSLGDLAKFEKLRYKGFTQFLKIARDSWALPLYETMDSSGSCLPQKEEFLCHSGLREV